MDAAQIFDELFARARERDEFEYACALLRIRGMEDAGWDPLLETEALFDDIVSLLHTPLNDYARVRLGLLLYSHLTEVDAIYRILANMVEITGGERCVMEPFQDLYGSARTLFARPLPPSAKKVVDRLKEKARVRGFDELVALVDWFFDEAVRNAFFHSDYVLHGDEFRTRQGTFVGEQGVLTASMKINRVVDLINRSIAFYGAFMRVYSSHLSSYREDKQVRGRLGPGDTEIDVTLLASEERGLYGFRASIKGHIGDT